MVLNETVCIMNPPFTVHHVGDGGYVLFLNKVSDMCDEFVSVNPPSAVIGKRTTNMNTPSRKFREYMNKTYCEIEQVNDKFMGAAINGGAIIVYCDRKQEHRISFNWDGHHIDYERQEDIKTYFYNDYLCEFERKIREFMPGKDCIENHLNLTPVYGRFSKQNLKNNNPDKEMLFCFCMQTCAMYGSVGFAEGNKFGFDKVKEYDENDQKRSVGYVNFRKDEREQAENFLKYIRTDFINMCKTIAYHSDIVAYNCYQIMPWLDFKKSYDDHMLFEMIGMEYDRDEAKNILKTFK